MILLTPEIRIALRTNDAAHRAAQRREEAEPDPVPVLKLFNPLGAGTWLATELDADGDTLFGLADLGFGCPELGSFSLAEIADVRLPFGLRIERDEHFASAHALSVWAQAARRLGSIIQAEALLRRRSDDPNGGLPADRTADSGADPAAENDELPSADG